MSEKNDFIQLPPIKKDTPSDVVAFIWEYMKVPENSREKVKNLLKDANENGVKLSHQAPTLYDRPIQANDKVTAHFIFCLIRLVLSTFEIITVCHRISTGIRCIMNNDSIDFF